jgi:hypothetical protein
MTSETKRINDRIKFDTIKNRIDDDDNNNNDDDDDDDDDALRTDITLIALGNVRVETMSWIQVIRNKYGFNDKLNPLSSSSSHDVVIKPGRTASASLLAAEIERNKL